MKGLGFELLVHPAYSSEIAPMDFQVFPIVVSSEVLQV